MRFGARSRPDELVAQFGRPTVNDLTIPTIGVPDEKYVQVTLTADTVANTKGAWTEIFASTSSDSHRILLKPGANSSGSVDSSSLMDVGIGAAGSEVVVIENIGVGYALGGFFFDLPLFIPAGSRVCARMQSVITGGRTMTLQTNLYRTTRGLLTRPSSSAQTYGASTANSRGVTIQPGSASEGNWFQITSSTSARIRAITIAIQGNGNTGMQGSTHNIDIGVGAAGSEVVIVENCQVATNNNEHISGLSPQRVWFVDIPAGSRIAMRSQAGGTTGALYIDAIVIGIEEVGVF